MRIKITHASSLLFSQAPYPNEAAGIIMVTDSRGNEVVMNWTTQLGSVDFTKHMGHWELRYNDNFDVQEPGYQFTELGGMKLADDDSFFTEVRLDEIESAVLDFVDDTHINALNEARKTYQAAVLTSRYVSSMSDAETNTTA